MVRYLRRRHRVFCGVKALLGVALLFAVSTSVWAAPGLDVALIVDRSRSMSRHAQLAPSLLRLSVELLERSAEAYGVEHRIAVISFGSSANIDVPFTGIRKESRAVAHRIDALSSVHGGETDILSGLVAAEGLFRSLARDPTRRRAIVLMTDGVPYVRGADMQRYTAELHRYVETHLAAHAVSIDVLLLTATGVSHHDALWRSLTHGVHDAGRAPADVLAAGHAVLTQLVGTPSAESALSKTTSGVDSLIVPPYLEMIVFDIFRSSADATVDVFPPDRSSPIREGVDGVETVRISDALTTLAVTRPRPGEWLIRKSRPGSRVRVRSQHFFPRGVLLQPDPSGMTAANDRVRIAYRVLDGAERSIREMPEYPLALRVTLARPDGTTVAVPMERDERMGPTTFRSTEDARCNVPGRYWTDVRVTTTDVEGRPLDVFRDRWSGFTVAASGSPRAQAAAMSPSPVVRSSRSLLWPVVSVTGGVLVIAAILQRRKTR